MEVEELTLSLSATSETTGEHVMCLALIAFTNETLAPNGERGLYWLVAEGSDGRPALEKYDQVRIDWRFDIKADAWIPVGGTVPPADK